uniref:Lipocalin-like domain-containing protein n=1 Tax=Solibacter usitatus (strain Ellin6076) TaxID=234267 RepID=Q024A0_SOLUE
MKTILLFVTMAALAGVALADTDVTGKWSGSFNATNPNGETKESTAVLVLKQNGAAITGTVGPNEDEQFPIQKGKIEGDKISIVADQDGHTMTFTLVLAAERITGEAQMSRDGQTMKAKIDVTRAK